MWWPMYYVLSWFFLKDSTAYVVLHIIQYHSKFLLQSHPDRRMAPITPENSFLADQPGAMEISTSVGVGEWFKTVGVVANCYDKQKRSWRAMISNFDVEEGRQSQLIPNVQLGPVSVKKGVRVSMLEQLVGGRTNELNILSLVVVRACLNVQQNWLPLSS